MPSFNFLLLVILGCGAVTLLTRVIPFIILKKINLPLGVVQFLSFVPIVIMATLWFEGLFIQHLGHLPTINWLNVAASVPTVISAVISKNLLVIVIVGMISLALLRVLLS